MKDNRISSVASLSLAVVAAVAFFAAPAKGALTLTISEPGMMPATTTAAGGSNSIVYTSAYGDFATDIVVGFSNSAAPSSVAQLQIQSLDVKNTTGTQAVLTITLSDNSFTFPGTVGSALQVSSSVGGTLTGTSSSAFVTFQTTATPSTGGAAVLPTQTFTSPGSLTPVSFSAPTVLGSFTQTGTYTLQDTLRFGLTNVGATANLSGTSSVSVPEPATLSIAGVAGLALFARRRRAR